MVMARLQLTEYTNQVLNVIKAKFNLHDKSEAVNKLGLNIPKDYSIIGYDNIEFTRVISPPLTTVHQPRKRIGELSANILLKSIEKENIPTCRKQLNPEIIIRESVQERD